MHIFSVLSSSMWSWVVINILTHPSSNTHTMFIPFDLSYHLDSRDSLPGTVTYTLCPEEAKLLAVQPLLACPNLPLTFTIVCESTKSPVNPLSPISLRCKSNPTFLHQLESVISPRLTTSFSIYCIGSVVWGAPNDQVLISTPIQLKKTIFTPPPTTPVEAYSLGNKILWDI